MNVFRSAIRLGPLLTMLALLMLGLGLGRVFATDGEQGVVGPGGITTLDLTRHRSVIVEGVPGARGSLSVSCPAGKVVGGGFSHIVANLQVIESRPHGIYTWRISWLQTSGEDSVLTAYAICMITNE